MYHPIAFIIPEYDRTKYKNWWLKAYEQGTVIPLAMATDASGATTLAKSQLNENGFPTTAGGDPFIPFLNKTYDLWLIPTELEANDNITINAIQFADNIMPSGIDTGLGSMPDMMFEGLEGEVRHLISFHTGLNKGGGVFRYSTTEDRANHNGVTIIDPTNTADLATWDAAAQTTWFTAGTGSGCLIRIYDGPILPEWGGAKGDGVEDDTQSIEAAIGLVNANGGTLEIGGESDTFIISSALSIDSNVTLDFKGTLEIAASVSNFITVSDGADNVKILNPRINCEGFCSASAIRGFGCTNLKILGGEITGWIRAITVNSSSTNQSKYITVGGLYIHSPTLSTGVGNPIQINNVTGRDLIENVHIDNNIIEGVTGAHTVTAGATGDQITLQGVKNFTCNGNYSINGGEIGISISRLSENGTVNDNVCEGCDADGIQIGGGLVKATVDSVSGWTADPSTGDTITGVTSGASGTLHTIDGLECYIESPTGGTFLPTEDLTNGTTVHTASDVVRARNITASGNTCEHNGLDDDSTGGVFAGIKLLQADDVSVIGNKCFDEADPKIQQFGLYVSQVGSIVDSGNDFSRNLTGTRSLNGVYSFNDTEVTANLVKTKGDTLEISSGNITVTNSFHIIDTEAAAATDDLNSITAGQDGQELTLRTVTGTRVVTINEGTTLKLSGTSFVMDGAFDTISFIYDEDIPAWLETARSDNN